MSARTSLLYLSHIDWNWIKQRPQFVAELLAEDHDVEVVYRRSWRRSFLVRNPTALRTWPLVQLPFRWFPGMSAADRIVQRAEVCAWIAARRPDLVWLTFPTQERLLPRVLPTGCRLVYDCMDDAPAFPCHAGSAGEVLAAEEALLARADVVLASSDDLAAKLARRGGDPGRISVVRNAFGGEILPQRPSPERGPGAPFRVGYVGTVSAWVDFEALAECARRSAGVEFHFIGPAEVPLPREPAFHFHGPVDHARLTEAVEPFDCFIVPFRRTTLVRSVDPVKVYDYVNFHRDIICADWPEVRRYSRFVHFYEGAADLASVVARLRSSGGVKYSNADRLAFLAQNTWSQRLGPIREALARSSGTASGRASR